MLNDDFNRAVQEGWKVEGNVNLKLEGLARNLRGWN